MTALLAIRGFLKKVPAWLWVALAAIVIVIGYGHMRYNAGEAAERSKRDAAIAAAVLKAVEAEREAQAKHEVREAERHTHTRELQEAASTAPVGSKTQAVLDALRGES